VGLAFVDALDPSPKFQLYEYPPKLEDIFEVNLTLMVGAHPPPEFDVKLTTGGDPTTIGDAK